MMIELEDIERALKYFSELQKMTKTEQYDLAFKLQECMLNLQIMKKVLEGKDYTHETEQMKTLWQQGSKGGLMN